MSGKFEDFSESAGKFEIFFSFLENLRFFLSRWEKLRFILEQVTGICRVENLSGCEGAGKFEVLSDTIGKFEEFFRRKIYE